MRERMSRRAATTNNSSSSTSAAGSSSSAAGSSGRGPRPAKTANCVIQPSPSPDSSSDNASDNSDLFQWGTTGSDVNHLTTTATTATTSAAAISRQGASVTPSSSTSSSAAAATAAATSASRKRKLLEQFLLPENASPMGHTISLSEMWTLGLVGQPRPSASIQATSMATPAVVGVSLASGAHSSTAGRTNVSVANFNASPSSSSSAFVPSFSFYQTRTFATPSCSGGGSTESLCSSTADSACGHPPDLPDDGNLATPSGPIGCHSHLDINSNDGAEVRVRPVSSRETPPIPCTGQAMNTASNRVAGWRLEDIDDNLAADFDGSLSGLGVDLSVASYNMSEALLALPTLTGFKQEAPSPPHGDHGRLGNNTSPAERASSEGRTVTSLTNHGHAHESEANYSHPFQHMLHQHSGWSTVDGSSGTGPIAGGGVETGSASSLASSSSNEGIPASGNIQQSNSSSHIDAYHGEKYKYDRLNEADGNADNRFQYVLAAATSIATKVNEESLTYLNQGQPYEIKMKKLGDLSNFRGKLLRSVVRLCFHERRLQYMEREQIAAWRMSRPGDRITEIDVPLSYGIYDVVQDNSNLNVVEFVWDPTKEVGVYIKVNCISTEFTPKKHGGEKGVPFRIQVETYSHADGDGSPIRLHVAGCQIKVFKLKGADRKHKQDREKIFKRPMSEQEKYQPSCECTILSEIPLELVYTSAIVPVGSTGNGNHVSAAPATASTVTAITSVPTSIAVAPSPTATVSRTYSPSELHKSKSFTSEGCAGESPLEHDASNVESPTSMMGSGGGALFQYYMHPLSVDASAQQTAQWLQSNRFSCHVRTFGKFAGADILRLSREDLIQICGLPDGIRLFNALHAKAMAPRLTLYLTQDQSHVFHAIFLENLSCVELGNKLAALVQLPPQHIMDVFIEGPCCIHVLVTDEVVQNMKDESMFNIELLPDQISDRYRLLLKSISPC